MQTRLLPSLAFSLLLTTVCINSCFAAHHAQERAQGHWHNGAHHSQYRIQQIWNTTENGAKRVGHDFKNGTEQVGHRLSHEMHRTGHVSPHHRQ